MKDQINFCILIKSVTVFVYILAHFRKGLRLPRKVNITEFLYVITRWRKKTAMTFESPSSLNSPVT